MTAKTDVILCLGDSIGVLPYSIVRLPSLFIPLDLGVPSLARQESELSCHSFWSEFCQMPGGNQ